MKLDLSKTTVIEVGSRNKLSELDLLGLRPQHPMLTVDRTEVDKDLSQQMAYLPPEVLHIRVVDGDRAAHFHVRVGVKKGRPFVEVCGLGRDSTTDHVKKTVGAWLPLADDQR